jgi:hypothetical protein
MNKYFSITNCDLSDMITETSRFLYHITLMHVITTCIIDKTTDLFGSQFIKTLFVTAMSVMAYHIIFKKTMNLQLENMQKYCYDYSNTDSSVIEPLKNTKTNKKQIKNKSHNK